MASQHQTNGKICRICGQDCSDRPRTKDDAGNYYCTTCYERARHNAGASNSATIHESTEVSSEEALELGWEALVNESHDEALDHFLAAAHAVPGSEEAQEGLLETLKVRFWPYRMMLWIGAHTYGALSDGGSRPLRIPLWFIVGIPGLLFAIIRNIPQTGIFLWPFLIAFFVCLIQFQVLDSSAILFAWASKQGRSVVTTGHLMGGILVFASMAATVSMSLLYLWVSHPAALMFAFVFFTSSTPLEQACTAPPGWARRLLLTFAVFLTGLGLATSGMMWSSCLGDNWDAPLPTHIGIFFLVFIGGLFVFGPVAKFLSGAFPRKRSYIDHSTYATKPGSITLSNTKLRRLHPEFYGVRALFHAWLHPEHGVSASEAREMIRQHLMHGDSCAAVVLSTQPLLVAAYSEDIDCVAVLLFESDLIDEYELQRGSRLLTVNTYDRSDQFAQDLRPGPADTRMWRSFWPVVADFLCNETGAVARTKSRIDEQQWKIAMQYGDTCVSQPAFLPRDGRPMLSHLPAVDLP